MSGAGKSTAMKMMEDMGFFCIDNLPIPLLDKLVDFTKSFDTQQKKIAIGIDARSGKSLDSLNTVLDELSKKDIKYEILFLDAEDNVLVKRSCDRHQHDPPSFLPGWGKRSQFNRCCFYFSSGSWQHLPLPVSDCFCHHHPDRLVLPWGTGLLLCYGQPFLILL